MTLASVRKKKHKGNPLRKLARMFAAFFTLLFILLTVAGNWFARHPREWLEEKEKTLPLFLTKALLYLGEPSADLTDSFGITGSDASVKTQTPKPSSKVLFAGIPKRKTAKAPHDITILNKGAFIVGWSPSLKRPVWCAYHVTPSAKYRAGKRPNFKKDSSAAACPIASSYARTGYDRGHLAPNYAIATRYGADAQAKTFLMSNIAPQTPELNRGVWREIEHRIADLFTARWGEVWVIVGAISDDCKTLSGTDISVPSAFYQIIITQTQDEIKALAFIIEQNVPWKAWPRRYLTSIDTVEKRSGLDFFSELDDSIEASLESQKAMRLWTLRFWDAFKSLKIHCGVED